ncbi:MAG: Fur family transcriptional regulator [bacterium]
MIPNISLGTVYRNLNFLREQNLVLKLDYGQGLTRFNGNPQNHYHFVCLSCQRVFDIEEPIRWELNAKVAGDTGFEISHHRMEFYGRCKECQKTERR